MDSPDAPHRANWLPFSISVVVYPILGGSIVSFILAFKSMYDERRTVAYAPLKVALSSPPLRCDFVVPVPFPGIIC